MDRLWADLAAARVRKGSPSYREMAQGSGIGHSTLQYWFTHRVVPPGPKFVKLVGYFGEDPRRWQRRYVAARAAAQSARGGAPPAGPQAVRPRQLPAATAVFSGRADALAWLDAHVPARRQGGRDLVTVLLVDGTAGVGKTALAVYWAHRVARRFPDGQLYVNLRGFGPGGQVMSPAEAVRGFLDALHVPPQRVPSNWDAQVGLYRSLTAGRRMLVVLDNARDCEQVRPLLPGGRNSLVLVTSRSQLTGLIAADGAHHHTLDLLTGEEAHELLASRLGAPRLAAEPGAVEEIVERCARLPLGLAIVAARAATYPSFPLAALAAELRSAGGRLDALAGEDATTDLRAVFSWSYHTLCAAAARLFRLLGLHPGAEFSAPAAASLAGVPLDHVRPALAELTRANLIVAHRPGRYGFHDLLGAYAVELAGDLDPADQRRAAVHRVLDHYLHTAHAAAVLLSPQREQIALPGRQPGAGGEHIGDGPAAMAWFAAEHAVLLAAAAHAGAAGFDVHCWQLAWTLADYLDRQGHWHDSTRLHADALAAAQRLADRRAQARIHRSLARLHSWLRRHDAAHEHLMHALDLHGRLGDGTGQAHTHLNIAWVCEQQGRYVESLEHAQHALKLLRATGNRFGQADALNNIGWYHSLLGSHQEALRHGEQALGLYREAGNQAGQAHAWDSLGHAHHHLGDHRKAAECYGHALVLLRDIGERYYEANTLAQLGDTYDIAGDPPAARDSWQQALAILADLDHPAADEVRAKLQRPGEP